MHFFKLTQIKGHSLLPEPSRLAPQEVALGQSEEFPESALRNFTYRSLGANLGLHHSQVPIAGSGHQTKRLCVVCIFPGYQILVKGTES